MFENHIVELEANMYDNYRLEETIALANLARIMDRLYAKATAARANATRAFIDGESEDETWDKEVMDQYGAEEAITIIQEVINKLRYVY